VIRPAGILVALGSALLLAGCGPDYSPNTYSATAVQQANKVTRGEVIGVRQIDVSAAGIAGGATGAAAGGAVGGAAASTASGTLGTTLGALGGGLVGGLLGTSVEHVTADTFAFEYIVREADKDGTLVSVTQKDKVPLKIGTKVLVIGGTQARIVPDYTLNPDSAETAAAPPPAAPAAAPAPASAPAPSALGSAAPAPLPTTPTSLAPAAASTSPTETAPAPAPVAAAPLAPPVTADPPSPAPAAPAVPAAPSGTAP
jgi:outer membrane lipoprotein SlyB